MSVADVVGSCKSQGHMKVTRRASPVSEVVLYIVDQWRLVYESNDLLGGRATALLILSRCVIASLEIWRRSRVIYYNSWCSLSCAEYRAGATS